MPIFANVTVKINKGMTERSIREIEEMGEGKYINPYTDFGFKKLFGTPLNKDLLISFLNSLFEGKEVVSDLTYLNGENLGNGYGDRRAIFDVYCENEQGETFIVEMQKAEQQFFKDRSVFYATFPIQNQGKKGLWDIRLKVSIRLESWISSSPTTNTPRTVFGTK